MRANKKYTTWKMLMTVFTVLLLAASTTSIVQPGQAAAQTQPNHLFNLNSINEITAITGTINPVYCLADVGGANDAPTQKDLTRLCIDTVTDPNNFRVEWDWDVLGGYGGLDVGIYFDSDGDGFANYGLYVSTTGNPAVLNLVKWYTCPGDDQTTYCSGATLASPQPTIPCTITSPVADDPFPAGDSYPNDAQGYCTVPRTLFGAQAYTTSFLNICSTPSGSISSAPSDCTAFPGGGFIGVYKYANPDDPAYTWNFEVNNGGQIVGTASFQGCGQKMFSFLPATFSVTETNPNQGTYALVYSACTNQLNTSVGTGSGTVSITNLSVSSGSLVICEFDNAMPTAVDLASFAATPQVKTVSLGWTSTSEVNIVGYNIYRSTDPAAAGIQLNTDMIPASYPGQMRGATYSFLDESAVYGELYTYTLQVVYKDGPAQWSEQVSATPTGYRLYVPITSR